MMHQVKQYLENARTIQLKIDDLNDELLKLDNTLGVRSPDPQSIPSDNHNSSTDSLILNVIAHKDEIKAEIISLMEQQKTITDTIRKLVDPMEYQCVYQRYIKGMTNEAVAKALDVSESSVRRYISKGCQKLSKIIRIEQQ